MSTAWMVTRVPDGSDIPIAAWDDRTGWTRVGPELIEKGVATWGTKKAALAVYGKHITLGERPAGVSVKAMKVDMAQLVAWCNAAGSGEVEPIDVETDDNYSHANNSDNYSHANNSDNYSDANNLDPDAPIIEGELVVAALPDPAEGIDLSTADLPTLAEVIKRGHDQVLGHARGLIVYAWHTGRALNAARGRFGYGDWLPWLEQNTDVSQPTAFRYMTLATNYASVNSLDPELSITGALKAIEPKANRKPRKKKDKEPTGPDFASSEWMAEGAWALVVGADGRRFIRTADGMFDLAAGPVQLTPDLVAEVASALNRVLDAIGADLDEA